MKTHPVKQIQDSLVKEIKEEMEYQNVKPYGIGTHGLVSQQTAGKFHLKEGLKLSTALAIGSSIGKTLVWVDMPDEMKQAVNEWHKTNKKK